jgi:hypothetical protein
MRTFQTTSLSEPSGAERISEGTFAYFRARTRRRVYSLVVDEFERSKISQADLARRLGKGTDVVCRWLGSPGNWTLDTLSDLLFAISGAEPSYAGVRYPLRVPQVLTSSVPDNDRGQVFKLGVQVVQTSTDQADKPMSPELVETDRESATVLTFETYRPHLEAA